MNPPTDADGAVPNRQQLARTRNKRLIHDGIHPAPAHKVEPRVHIFEMIQELELDLALEGKQAGLDVRIEHELCAVDEVDQTRFIEPTNWNVLVIDTNFHLRVLRLRVEVQNDAIGSQRTMNFLQGIADALTGDSSQ